MVPRFVLIVAVTLPAGIVVEEVDDDGLATTFFLLLPPVTQLMMRIAATKTAPAMAALRMVRITPALLDLGLAGLAAARAFSFLR